MNPEMLVLHKPTSCFDDFEAANIVKLIRNHVDERGLELPADGRSMRRPRTAFFTASTLVGVQEADEVFKVSHSEGVIRVNKDQIDMRLLV